MENMTIQAIQTSQSTPMGKNRANPLHQEGFQNVILQMMENLNQSGIELPGQGKDQGKVLSEGDQKQDIEGLQDGLNVLTMLLSYSRAMDGIEESQIKPDGTTMSNIQDSGMLQQSMGINQMGTLKSLASGESSYLADVDLGKLVMDEELTNELSQGVSEGEKTLNQPMLILEKADSSKQLQKKEQVKDVKKQMVLSENPTLSIQNTMSQRTEPTMENTEVPAIKNMDAMIMKMAQEINGLQDEEKRYEILGKNGLDLLSRVINYSKGAEGLEENQLKPDGTIIDSIQSHKMLQQAMESNNIEDLKDLGLEILSYIKSGQSSGVDEKLTNELKQWVQRDEKTLNNPVLPFVKNEPLKSTIKLEQTQDIQPMVMEVPQRKIIEEGNLISPRAFSLGNKFNLNESKELSKEDSNQNSIPSIYNIIAQKVEPSINNQKIPAIQNMNEITLEMVQEINKFKEGDQSIIQMKLKPEELGDIEINLQMKGGQIIGKILVDNELVKGTMENQLHLLKDQLKNQNITLHGIEVELSQYSNQQGNNHQQSFYQQNNKPTEYPYEEEQTDFVESDGVSHPKNEETKGLNLIA